MNYEEAVAYIEDIPRFTTKNSLDHTRECLRRLGDPQRKFRVIHVAGTNGKGSTCAFITSVLREAGYSCGLFTSPHLVEINERFQINEEVIDDDTFLRAFEKVKKLSDELVAEGSYKSALPYRNLRPQYRQNSRAHCCSCPLYRLENPHQQFPLM